MLIYTKYFSKKPIYTNRHTKAKVSPFIVTVNMTRKIRTRISIVPSNAFVFFPLVLLDLAPRFSVQHVSDC